MIHPICRMEAQTVSHKNSLVYCVRGGGGEIAASDRRLPGVYILACRRNGSYCLLASQEG